MTGITLALTGYVMLGRLVDETIAREGFAYPWGDMLPRLRAADLLMVNLECALTASREPWHDGDYKAFYFRAEPAVAETLRLAGVRFASLANNHVLDYGLRETREVLDAAGIAQGGAGDSLEEARAPVMIAAGEMRVGVVSFADHPFAWRAEAALPGVNYTPVSLAAEDWRPVRDAISAARAASDVVVFSIHWGPNMRLRPPPDFRDFAHAVIDAGVDLFWGHSAHLVQGIEVYRNRAILYDTGDFVDDYAIDPALRNDLSALFLARMHGRRIESIDLVPVRIDQMQVNEATGRERDRFLRRTADLSAELGATLQISGAGASVQVTDQLALEHRGVSDAPRRTHRIGG